VAARHARSYSALIDTQRTQEPTMISRLTAFAATFAVLAAASIAFAASAHQSSVQAAAQSARAMPVVQLQTVVVTGHRSQLAADER
jgi:hypothetical protein